MKLVKFDSWNFQFYCDQSISDAKTDELAPQMESLKARIKVIIEDNLPEEIALMPEE